MSNPAILVENLSKQYKIGRAKQHHDTLRDALVDGFKRFNDEVNWTQPQRICELPLC